MTLLLGLPDGHSAELLETDGQRVCLLSPHPSPTGSVVRAILSEGEPPVQIKVRGCHRIAEGTDTGPQFRIEGRFVNLSRKQRAQLLGH